MEKLFRQNDGLLLLCQDNINENIFIKTISPLIEELIGYHDYELKDKSLFDILSINNSEIIKDNIEFTRAGNDLQYILQKTRQLKLLHKDGREIDVEFRCIRSESLDRNLWFRLLVKDPKEQEKIANFRNILRENFRGYEILDKDINIPDKKSFIKDLELVSHYQNSKGLDACLACIRIDNIDEFDVLGKENSVDAMRQISILLKRTLRDDDRLGKISHNLFGIMLMHISPNSIRFALNRIRRELLSLPIEFNDIILPKYIDISICFGQLYHIDNGEYFLDKYKKKLQYTEAGSMIVMT